MGLNIRQRYYMLEEIYYDFLHDNTGRLFSPIDDNIISFHQNEKNFALFMLVLKRSILGK